MLTNNLQKKLDNWLRSHPTSSCGTLAPKVLPGRISTESSPELSYGRHAGPAAFDHRVAAVMVLLYPRNDQWLVPLTLRPSHMQFHADQVSFPGGIVEAGETPEACALRELSEEVGVDESGLRFLGRLSAVYIYGSNFLVTPCVAIRDEVPQFSPNADEVAEVLEMPLMHLLESASHGEHVRERRGVRYRVPHLLFAEQRIWGATYMMLAELRATILCEKNDTLA